MRTQSHRQPANRILLVRCLIRADAGEAVGTGHVMRCLTIAEELVDRGHEVVLRGSFSDVPWLDARIAETGVVVESAAAGVLGTSARDYTGFDVAIIDSYVYPADAINTVDGLVPVLAVIDGDARGIDASAYLDQNLGAAGTGLESQQRERLIAGSRFALVRREIRDLRRSEPREPADPPRVCAFMGGSDPTGAMVTVARALNDLPTTARVDLVVTDRWWDAVAREVRRGSTELHHPTPRLPLMLAEADVVISATGTSAWDVCTLGIPAVFTTVADNQRAGYEALVGNGLALGVDLSNLQEAEGAMTGAVVRILDDATLRQRLFEACTEHFDGYGPARVADRLERLAASRDASA